MNATQATTAVADALAAVAPEIDPSTVDMDAPFQAELDLDSLDFLKLIQVVHERTGVDIPEDDYARVDTLNNLTAYVAAHG